MCDFFSFLGDGFGNYKFFPWSEREKLLIEKKDINPDSHTEIANFYGVPEDKWSKYEYNPITKAFTIDSGIEGHNHDQAEKWARALDFGIVCPFLIIKEIENPLQGRVKKVTEKDIANLEKWDSVWDSVGYSVRASVKVSVGDSVGALVWASVRASVRAYLSTFFNIKYKIDFTSVISLWNRGFVPSFDGTIWRLHSGKDAKIVYEWKKEK